MNKTQKYLSALVVLALVFIAGQASSSIIKLSAIKPTGSSQPLTDEQQAILAVRIAKASVVNIVGVPPVNPANSNTSSAPTISVGASSVSGTGFVIEADGLIVTNNHVIDTTGLDYSVVMADGTEYPATIVGTDKFDDIALIKINAQNLVPATLGNSDTLETGQTVFAIGNSLGRYQNTVTRGVVSGLSRAVDESSDNSEPTTHNWIQTDAAINLGNSGGPLIDLSGEVIGMNTLIDSEGESLGFAIPVNSIKDAVQQLKTFGAVSRPYLGVMFTTITPEVLAGDNLPVQNGALIAEVIPGGPADTAGVMAGDIITGVNNTLLGQINTLDAVIQKFQAGTQVSLKIFRNNGQINLPIVVGEQK